MHTDHDDVEEWLAARKREALKIDLETAEVMSCYTQVLDPYGVDHNLPEEYYQVGEAYFARSPESDIWVWFGDLPKATREGLLKNLGPKLAADFEDCFLW
jgi:hypothetical protein